MSKKNIGADDLQEEEDDEQKESSSEEKTPPKAHNGDGEEAEDPKWKIALKSLVFLTVGVGLVSPMYIEHVVVL